MTLRQLLDLNIVDNGKHLNDEVVSFGFYDGQLCVRLDIIDL